mmetsp:Transcript_6700/g.8724  ORF Transcript_6700/g.8724 Transcript_6700/m.8724 type:complete len:262 (-) Transcript_6700:1-786(-)
MLIFRDQQLKRPLVCLIIGRDGQCPAIRRHVQLAGNAMERDVVVQHALELLLLRWALLVAIRLVGTGRNGVRVLGLAWKAVQAGTWLGSPLHQHGRRIFPDAVEVLGASGIIVLPRLAFVVGPHVHQPVGHASIRLRDAVDLSPPGRRTARGLQVRQALGSGHAKLRLFAVLVHPVQHVPVIPLPDVVHLRENLVPLPVHLEVDHAGRVRGRRVNAGPHFAESLCPGLLIALVDPRRAHLVSNGYCAEHGRSGDCRNTGHS